MRDEEAKKKDLMAGRRSPPQEYTDDLITKTAEKFLLHAFTNNGFQPPVN